MFRNLTMFRFPASLDLSGIDAAVAECALKPVGPLEFASRGWVSPYGGADDRLVQRLQGTIHLTLGGEDKLLPAAAVNAGLAKRLAAIERTEGRRPGGRARKRVKEDVVHELLPRALVKPSRLDGYLDLKRGLVVVDTASRKAAEGFVSELRHALGSFPALPLNAEVAPRGVLTDWLWRGSRGHILDKSDMYIGDECELRDAADHGAIVRFQRQELQGSEIDNHLEAGKQCTRLGLVAGCNLSLTLGENLVVRKLRFLDGCMEKLETDEREDMQAELDARATLLAGEVGRLFDTLERAFQLSKAEG